MGEKEVEKKMEFRIATHTLTGDDMVEVWRDGEFVGGVYSHKEGLRIVSKHLNGVKHEVGMPPVVIVKLSD